jgi:hypothetical protein
MNKVANDTIKYGRQLMMQNCGPWYNESELVSLSIQLCIDPFLSH